MRGNICFLIGQASNIHVASEIILTFGLFGQDRVAAAEVQHNFRSTPQLRLIPYSWNSFFVLYDRRDIVASLFCCNVNDGDKFSSAILKVS